jgi:hypothetical protein
MLKKTNTPVHPLILLNSRTETITRQDEKELAMFGE